MYNIYTIYKQVKKLHKNVTGYIKKNIDVTAEAIDIHSFTSKVTKLHQTGHHLP